MDDQNQDFENYPFAEKLLNLRSMTQSLLIESNEFEFFELSDRLNKLLDSIDHELPEFQRNMEEKLDKKAYILLPSYDEKRQTPYFHLHLKKSVKKFFKELKLELLALGFVGKVKRLNNNNVRIEISYCCSVFRAGNDLNELISSFISKTSKQHHARTFSQPGTTNSDPQ